MKNEHESKSIAHEVGAEEEIPLSDVLEQFDAIKKLKELLDLGAITQGEFEQKKRELLSRGTKKTLKLNNFVILLWASLGFTIFSYLINVIISLNVGGNLFWMFDYIFYGYIAGFIMMAAGIVGYIFSFHRLTKQKEALKAKVISLILMIALLCTTFSPLVMHDPCTYEASIKWADIGPDTYNVVNCEYRRTHVKISSKHKGSRVDGIGFGAFSHHNKLKEVTIPDTITSIGGQAFAFCENLKTLVIPDSVTLIGPNAFLGCNSLVIYCEAESKPEGWDETWNYRIIESDENKIITDLKYVTVYWGGEWEYDWLGNPVPFR